MKRASSFSTPMLEVNVGEPKLALEIDGSVDTHACEGGGLSKLNVELEFVILYALFLSLDRRRLYLDRAGGLARSVIAQRLPFMSVTPLHMLP